MCFVWWLFDDECVYVCDLARLILFLFDGVIELSKNENHGKKNIKASTPMI